MNKEPELKPCPFCGREADHTGLYPMELVESWVLDHSCANGDSPSSVRFYADTRQGCIDARNKRTEPSNEPLTLEELRGMDGEPVYIRLGDGDQFWALVTIDQGELGLIGEYYDHECPEGAFYGMYHEDPAGHFGLHVLGWLAYRWKPEGGDAR